MPKQARIAGIKSLKCYTFEEASDVTGVSPRTIRNWRKKGLTVLDGDTPFLIRGDDLKAFIKAQRKGRKVPLDTDAFYCLPCRAPRHAAGEYAECEIIGNQAKLTALCNVCEGVISKVISPKHLPELKRTLDLTITQKESRL